jgi:hypothetical protein
MPGLKEYAEQNAHQTQEVSKTSAPAVTQQLPLARLQKAMQEDEIKAAAVYKEYQENSKQAMLLDAEILKGLKAGAPLQELFLKAMKVISLLTHNKLLFTQSEESINAMYVKKQ